MASSSGLEWRSDSNTKASGLEWQSKTTKQHKAAIQELCAEPRSASIATEQKEKYCHDQEKQGTSFEFVLAPETNYDFGDGIRGKQCEKERTLIGTKRSRTSRYKGLVLGSFLAPEIDMRRSWAPLVLDTFHSTLHTVHSTFIQRFTLLLCTQHSTLHFTPNLHSSLHLHSTLYTLHTPNSTLLTPHFYTPHSHSSLCKSQHLVGRIPCTGVIAW